jgi:small conductance mechanosensitive channel
MLKIAVILALSKASIFIVRKIIKKILKRRKTGRPFSVMARKKDTIESVFVSITRYAVYFFAATAILSVLGLSATVSSLITTAGVGGIAIAFGAQSLVKDVVSGMFTLIENQYSVGEYIEVDGEKGTVEAITIRTTSILKFTGEIMTIPNGSITKLINYSRKDMLAVIDIPVAYETDIGKISGIMYDVGLEYMEDHDNILEEPHVLGIIELSDSKMVLRMIIRVKPLTHWETERALRRLIIEKFESSGVSFPYPRRVVLKK